MASARPPVDSTVTREALNALREAYEDECHLAASSVIAKVQSGEVDTDEELWDAIVATHQTRVDGATVTPRWTPLLLSGYRFEDTVSTPVAAGLKIRKESDALWEANRKAWVYDVCHVLKEHHDMPVLGLTRDRFIAGNPIDAIVGRTETLDHIIASLHEALDAPGSVARDRIKRQITRLERANRHLNKIPPRPPSLPGTA